MNDTYQRLGALLVERCGVERRWLAPSATFDDLGLDSMDYMTLAIALQREFGVEVDEDDLLPGDTLADWVTHIDTRRAAA